MTQANPQFRESQPNVRPVSSLLAGWSSFFFPGLGQLVVQANRPAAAALLAVLLADAIAVAVLLYLPVDRANAGMALGIFVFARLGVAAHAWRCASRYPNALTVARRMMVGVAGVLAIVLVQFGAAMLIRAAWCEAFVMPAANMSETVLAGDRVLADKRWYSFTDIRRGDIVAYRNPRGFVLIQRVIALPGDEIEMRQDVVYINGLPIKDAYITLDSIPFIPEQLNNFAPLTVPAGHVYVLGDRRMLSHDSRQEGPVPINDVIGRVKVIYFSVAPESDSLAEPWARDPDSPAGTVRWKRVGLRLD